MWRPKYLDISLALIFQMIHAVSCRFVASVDYRGSPILKFLNVCTPRSPALILWVSIIVYLHRAAGYSVSLFPFHYYVYIADQSGNINTTNKPNCGFCFVQFILCSLDGPPLSSAHLSPHVRLGIRLFVVDMAGDHVEWVHRRQIPQVATVKEGGRMM